MVLAPLWAHFRLFPPDQARKRDLSGRVVPVKSPCHAHSSVPAESVLSSPDAAGCHLLQAQGWPGGFESPPGLGRERHALCQWKYLVKPQEQVLTVSASSVFTSPPGSRKPHSFGLSAQNLIYLQKNMLRWP